MTVYTQARTSEETVHFLNSRSIALGLLVIEHLYVDHIAINAHFHLLVVVRIVIFTFIHLGVLTESRSKSRYHIHYVIWFARFGSKHIVVVAFEIGIFRYAHSNGALYGIHYAIQVQTTQIWHFIDFLYHLAYLRQTHQICAVHAHGCHHLHAVRYGLEECIRRFLQHCIEQLRETAIFVHIKVYVHITLIVIESHIKRNALNVVVEQQMQYGIIAHPSAHHRIGFQYSLNALSVEVGSNFLFHIEQPSSLIQVGNAFALIVDDG